MQKLWSDTVSGMVDAWSNNLPQSGTPADMKNLRGGMLKAISKSWEEFMRTPQFMEMMTSSLNAAMSMHGMTKDGLNRAHQGLQTPSKDDIESVLLAVRHIERRILDRIDDFDQRLQKVEADRARDGNGDLERTILERLDALSERLAERTPEKGSAAPAAADGKAPRTRAPKRKTS